MTAITIPTHVRFGNLVKAESRKYVNTRAALVLSILMAAVLAMVTIGVIAAYPDLTKVATGTNLQFLPLAMTSVLTAIIVILPVTSEWTQRGVLTTFVVEPRRERIIAAKALVALGVVLTVWLAIQLSCAVFNAVGAAAHGLEASWEVHWTRWLGGIEVLFLNAAVAFALALLLRNTALTITVFVAVPFTVGALSQFGELLEKITAWLRSPGAILQTILSTQKDGQTPDATLWGQFTVGVVVWIVVPLAIGLWLNCRADAK